MSRSQCQACGACCAFFRVMFPSCEINNNKTTAVPISMTHPYDVSQSIMNGTELKFPRCNALRGDVGFKVSCSIYLNRPSTCRDFKRSWKKNTGNHKCDKARAAYGLQPFSQYWKFLLEVSQKKYFGLSYRRMKNLTRKNISDIVSLLIFFKLGI